MRRNTFLGYCFGALLMLSVSVSAQQGELTPLEIEIIESFVESIEAEGEFDFNGLFDQLAGYLQKPIDLNKASLEELEESFLLTSTQMIDLIYHRNEQGPLMTIYELQSIPSFDISTIRSILPFVSIDSKLENFNVSVPDMIKGGKDEVIMRWERSIQEKKGFKQREDGTTPYLGDPNRFYIRYRHNYENRLSFGLTAEKDEGEEFGKGSNKQGFDFYSGHFYLKNYSKTLKAVALGDYTLQLGQGLVIYNGFTNRKSALVTNIKRGGFTIQPYKSVGESQSLRGASATLAFGDHIEVTPFISYQNQDANVVFTVTSDTTIGAFTSVQLSGKHRTENEIEDEGALRELIFGGRVQAKWRRIKVGLNAAQTDFQFRDFNGLGIKYFNTSFDYAATYKNVHVFGETAYSNRGRLDPDIGGIATTNSLLLGLGQFTQLALLYRNFSPNYGSIYSRPFANATRPENENGLYFGLEIKPMKKIFIYLYADLWSNSKPSSNDVFATGGREFFARIRYYKKRQTEVYLQFRRKTTEDSDTRLDVNIDPVVPMNRTQYRIHFSQNISKALTWRNRIEYINYSVLGRDDTHGFMAYQDILFKPLSFPLEFTTRFAIFDTDPDQFRTSPYAYENDILYSFFIPAYSGRGSRFYINLRYRPMRYLTLEARYEQTHLPDSESFSSGNEEILGPTRSRVKAQIKFQF